MVVTAVRGVGNPVCGASTLGSEFCRFTVLTLWTSPVRKGSRANMGQTSERAPVEILLVEDNPADVRLAREALREGQITSNLSCVSNGVEALAFLRREADFSGSPRPDIILLDLNLPQIDGFAVLTEIKDDPDLRTIPVVVLTTSSNPDDILRAYELHASFYIKKPADLDEFVNAMQSFDGFCLTVAQLPPRSNSTTPSS